MVVSKNSFWSAFLGLQVISGVARCGWASGLVAVLTNWTKVTLVVQHSFGRGVGWASAGPSSTVDGRKPVLPSTKEVGAPIEMDIYSREPPSHWTSHSHGIQRYGFSFQVLKGTGRWLVLLSFTRLAPSYSR